MLPYIAVFPLLGSFVSAFPAVASDECPTTTVYVSSATGTYTVTNYNAYSTVYTGVSTQSTYVEYTDSSTTSTFTTLTTTPTVYSTHTETATCPSTSTIYTTPSVTSAPAPPHYMNKRCEGTATVNSTIEFESYPHVDDITTTYYFTHPSSTTTLTTQTSTFVTTFVVIATATAQSTVTLPSGPEATSSQVVTIKRDARCDPSKFTSSYQGQNITQVASPNPSGDAHFFATTKDAAECCQMCADIGDCGGMGWNTQTKKCFLSFSLSSNGQPICGPNSGAESGIVGYYSNPNYPPSSPNVPWILQGVCGSNVMIYAYQRE